MWPNYNLNQTYWRFDATIGLDQWYGNIQFVQGQQRKKGGSIAWAYELALKLMEAVKGKLVESLKEGKEKGEAILGVYCKAPSQGKDMNEIIF